MPREGQTATNPQTGERIVFRGGVWQPAGGGAGSVAPSSAPQPIVLAGPDPDLAAERERQAASEARARAAEARAQASHARTMAAPAPGSAASATEGERTAAFLATRVAGGINDLQSALREAPTAASPEWDATIGGALFGETARNLLNSEPRQRVEAAQRDILDAALTLGTGAAYTAEQLEGYRRSYFPQIGDSPDTIADKQQRLRRALEAARVKAGAAAPQIDAALAALGGSAAAPQPQGAVRFNDEIPEGDPRRDASFEQALRQGIEGGMLNSVEAIVAFGRQHNKEIDPATAQQNLEFVQRGGRNLRDPQFQPPDISDQRGAQGGENQGLEAGVRGAGNTLLMGFDDEIYAIGDTIAEGGTFADNLARQRAINSYDEQHNFAQRLSGQLVGGLVLPAGGATTPGRLAAVGAGYGGVYGFGSGEGGVTDRLLSAGQGAAVGGAAGGSLGLIGNHLPRGRGPGPGGGRTGPQDLLAAADRRNIVPLPADVGGVATRRITAGLAQTPFGSGPVIRGAERVTDEVGAQVAAMAAAEGAPIRQEVLGETIEGALGNFNVRSGQQGSATYTRAREMAGDTQFAGERALTAVDQNLAELSGNANTNAPLIAGLQRLRADLANEAGAAPKSIDDIRQLRTAVRSEAQSEGLRGTDYQRRARQVLDSLSEDIAAQLPDDAAREFRRADQQWAERLDFIDDVETRLLGPRGDRSAEQISQRLFEMSRSDSARFRRVLEQVTPEEAGIIRGSVINELGRASSGQQGAAGQKFSLESFLTNWDRLPERARESLFRGENRAAIEDLARIAEGSREASRFANRSGTSGASNVSEIGRGISYGAGWTTLGATVVLEHVTGRLMASPRFTRFLGWQARNKPTPDQMVRKLGRIASREPALAPDILPIREALGQVAPRAAAEDVEDRR